MVVCHCKGGKGRTGVVIAAYIQFTNRYLTPEEALGKFADKRFYDESSGGVTQPSQRRMVHYFSALIKNEIQLENRQLELNTIILFGCPQIDGKHGARICFCIYEGFKLIHTTKVYGVTPDREHVYISLNNVKVQSDVMIKAFHIGKTTKTCILRTQFHTAFVKHDYNMVFRKKEIDIACIDDRFPEDGVLQVIFKPRTSVVTDNIDSTAHLALVSDQQEAKEVEDMTKEISLMSFDSDYADFSSFFTDNPLSETKQNKMLDGILTLHEDYKLISPLLPFSDSPPPPGSDQDSGKGESPPCGAPPPLPPKGKNKDNKNKSPPSSSKDSGPPPPVISPLIPPRKGRPPAIENPNILTSYLVESKDEADYLSFEVATPVKNLVQKFEGDDQNQNFTNWVKFDEEKTEDDKTDPLLDLLSPPEVVLRRKSATLDGSIKSKVSVTRSEPSDEPLVRRRGTLERDHEAVRRKTKSMEIKSVNSVENDRGKKKGERKSCYIPYLQRKESVKKEDGGKKRYVPYKMRTDSFGTTSRSGSESSGTVLSPPPLPPRGDKAAPGLGSRNSNPKPEPMTGESGEALKLPPRRLGSLSKSMDNLPCSNQVSMNMEGPETSNPDSVEYSLKNWEHAQKRKVVQRTKKIWFQPEISRQESQATLVSQCPGAFIIRKSQTLCDSFGLTIRLEDGKNHDDFNLHPGSHKVSNFLIQRKENGSYFINGFGSVDFATLEDLVEYFTNHTGGLPHPLCVPTQPYADHIDKVIPMLLRNVSFPVFILEKRCIRYLPLDSFAEDNVKTLLTETLSHMDADDVRLISMSVTKHGISLTDPDCVLFDTYSIPYKQIKNCEVGSRDQTISLPNTYSSKTAPTFGLIHRDKEGEIIYIALAEYEDKGLSITKTINKFRSYLV